MQSGGREDYLRLKEEYLRLRKDYLHLNEEYLCIKEEYLRKGEISPPDYRVVLKIRF